MDLSTVIHDLYPVQLIKLYLDQYRGITKQSWYRVTLTFINDLASGIIFFLPIYFVQLLHFNVATAGIIISCHGVGKALGGHIGGRLTEKMNPDKIVMYCLLIDALMFAGLMTAISLFAILAIVFILGVTAYTFSTANKICVLDSAKSDESSQIKLLSVFYASSNLGIGLSAMVIGYLSVFGFKTIFLLSSLILIISFISVMLQQGSPVKLPVTSNEMNSDPCNPNDLTRNYLIPYFMLGSLFVIGMIISQLGSTYPIYLSHVLPNHSINAVSIVFTINSLLILFLQTPVANYFGGFNKIITIGIGAFLMAGSMASLIVTHSMLALIFAMFAYTLGEMIFFSLAQFVIYQHSSPSRQARNVGLFQTVLAVSMIIGPTVGGYLYHQCGGNILWAACGVAGLLCLVVTIHFKKYDLIAEG